MLNFYLIENAMTKAKDIECVLKRLYNNDSIAFFWISPQGEKKENLPSDTTRVEYHYSIMHEGLEKTISDIEAQHDSKHLILLDLGLNQSEDDRIKKLGADEYIADTAKEIVKLINGRVKVIIISIIPKIRGEWRKVLSLDADAYKDDIMFISGRSMSGGNDTREVKEKINSFIK